MKHGAARCLVAILAAAALPPAFGAEATDGIRADIDGVFIEDATWLDGLSRHNAPGYHWQRRRLTLEGSVDFGSKLTLVAEGGQNNGTGFAWRDAYAALDLPGPWDLRAGLMKPDFGLAYGTSLRNLFTLERSLALDLLDLGRAPGIVLETTPGAHRAQFAWFEQEDADGEAIDVAVARYLFGDKSDDGYWHAGVSLAHQDYDRAVYRVHSRAETALMDNFLRTERITAEHVDYGGVDLLYQRGRLTLLGEVLRSNVASPREGNRRYGGGYVQVSWFLSNDAHRLDAGEVQRLQPVGWGAWELVTGLGYLDAWSRDDGFAAATRSLGLNFYHGEHLKLMLQLDWLRARRGDYAGQNGMATMARLQLRF
jgi:phosphate-selective porin